MLQIHGHSWTGKGSVCWDEVKDSALEPETCTQSVLEQSTLRDRNSRIWETVTHCPLVSLPLTAHWLHSEAPKGWWTVLLGVNLQPYQSLQMLLSFVQVILSIVSNEDQFQCLISCISYWLIRVRKITESVAVFPLCKLPSTATHLKVGLCHLKSMYLGARAVVQ